MIAKLFSGNSYIISLTLIRYIFYSFFNWFLIEYEFLCLVIISSTESL